MSKVHGVNVEGTHQTFLSDIQSKYGEDLGKLVQIHYFRAIHLAADGFPHSALEAMDMVLKLLPFAPDVEDVTVYGFLADLLLNMEELADCRRMLDRAWELYDEEQDTQGVWEALQELESRLGGEFWKLPF